LPNTLAETLSYLRNQPYSARITVVDNGSVDRTVDRTLDFLGNRETPVRAIGCARPGKGAAVRVGMLNANATFVGFMDADLATPLSALRDVLTQLSHGVDVAIASRRAKGAKYVARQSPVRRLGSRAFRVLASSLVPAVADTQCGLKFFRRDSAIAIFSACRVTGFAFDLEVMGRAESLGLTVAEVPVEWSDMAGSSVSLQTGVQAFREGFRLFSKRAGWAVPSDPPCATCGVCAA